MHSKITFSCLFVVCVMYGVEGHGFLSDPYARSAAYLGGYNTPVDYNHNGLNCGGFDTQWEDNAGQCGVCGDSFSGPRHHEAGNSLAPSNRPITGNYNQGGTLRVEVTITAHHMGYFTFRLCPHNDLTTEVTQDCLNERILYLSDDATNTKYDITNGTPGLYVVDLQLPSDVVCSQCVLQWNYTAGNSYRSWANESGCLGCGPQETFINCADIAIHASNGTTNFSSTSTTSTVAQSTTMSVLMSSTSTMSPTTTSNSVTSSTVSSTSSPTSTSSCTSSSTVNSTPTASSTTSGASTTTSTILSTSESISVSSSSTSSSSSSTSSLSTSTSTSTSTTPSTETTTTAPPATSTTPSSTTYSTATSAATSTASAQTSSSSSSSSTTSSTSTTISPTTSTTTTVSNSATCVRACTNEPSNICNCKVASFYENVPGMLTWCYAQCTSTTHYYCPQSHCTCYCP